MDVRTACSIFKLPPEIAKSLEKSGVTELYEWQSECIRSTNVASGGSLIYCAPTSGGKSLIAELAILSNAITARKKSILILPYVSLVIEKERDLRRLLHIYNRYNLSPKSKIKVKSIYGQIGISTRGIAEDIIICTIEKANAIINSLIVAGQIDRLGCVAIDELHVLGDFDRGYILEILVSKLRFLKSQVGEFLIS